MYNPLTQFYHWVLGQQTSSAGVDSINGTAQVVASIPENIGSFFSTLKLWAQIAVAVVAGILLYKITKFKF